MDLREVGYDDRDWINLAQDRYRWRAYCRILAVICLVSASVLYRSASRKSGGNSKTESRLKDLQGGIRLDIRLS
ncbi:hypothetical protein ANN_01096 [Periplaneta americana]|uniref:Uncharacterized protein n=1 Tax=Periplaneta americana TaxID=6978 RepID=A0ABQ8TUD5_PERAM|nr:hypothetical protein ANN_01096 [Periplaneta americana]